MSPSEYDCLLQRLCTTAWRAGASAIASHQPLSLSLCDAYLRRFLASAFSMIGSGNVDLGAKAMIHSIAAKAKGYDVTAIGECFVVHLKRTTRLTDMVDYLFLRTDPPT